MNSITNTAANQGDFFVDILKKMEKEEGSDLVKAMISIYIKRIPFDILEIEKALENNQAEFIQNKAHFLCGSFSSLSFINGYQLAKSIEKESKIYKPKQIESIIIDLISYMNESLIVIKNMKL